MQNILKMTNIPLNYCHYILDMFYSLSNPNYYYVKSGYRWNWHIY